MEPDIVTIPAGELVLGVPAVPKSFSLPHRWHTGKRIHVDAFQLSCAAITNAHYRTFLDDTGGPDNTWMQKLNYDRDDQPVVNINWYDAKAYCDWLRRRTGKGFRLPSDVEWEYAARGQSAGSIFPWGDELDEAYACYGGKEAPQPVASHPPNGFGLYDMIGNVWQWCEDRYKDASCGQDALNKIDDSTDTSQNRVLRGGSFLTTNPHCLYIAYRHEDPPDLRHQCLGFRVAL